MTTPEQGEIHFEQLPMFPGGGRHVLHDPRSRQYDARALVTKDELVSVQHPTSVPPWDQGEVGACTAFAAFGACVHDYLLDVAVRAEFGTDPTAADCLNGYRYETRIDDSQIPGHWEPEDTGSTGLWSAKMLRYLGVIGSYYHCFRTSTVLQVLQDRPVSIGSVWFNSMFEPDHYNQLVVDPESGVAGGHQWLLVGYDAPGEKVRLRQSWGTSWGDGGYAWMAVAALDSLLAQDGDATVFLPAASAD